MTCQKGRGRSFPWLTNTDNTWKTGWFGRGWCPFWGRRTPGKSMPKTWPLQIQTADGQLASVTRGMGDVVRGSPGKRSFFFGGGTDPEQPEMEKTGELKWSIVHGMLTLYIYISFYLFCCNNAVEFCPIVLLVVPARMPNESWQCDLMVSENLKDQICEFMSVWREHKTMQLGAHSHTRSIV